MIFRIDQRSHDHVWVGHRGFRKKSEPQSSLDHPLNPIVTWRTKNDARYDASAVQIIAYIAEDLTLRPVDIGLLVQVYRMNLRFGRQAMVGWQQNDELFVEDRKLVQCVWQTFMAAHEGYFEVSLFQALNHLGRAVVDDLNLDVGIIGLKSRQQAGYELRSDRAHNPDLEFGFGKVFDGLCQILCSLRLLFHTLKIGQHDPAEFREVGITALTVEQGPAKFVLELLDGAGQSRLRHVASFGGSREVKRLCQRYEIANLLHFHKRNPSHGPTGALAKPWHRSLNE